MGRIRTIREEDIDDLVSIFVASFRHHQRKPDSLPEYFKLLFLNNPWSNRQALSLVYEDDSGKPLGMFGIYERTMLFQGSPITVAIGNTTMVDASARGIAGLALTRAFFEGPQILKIADRANHVMREMWEVQGGYTALWQSLHWTATLRPLRRAWSQLGLTGFLRLANLATRPVTWALDRSATTLVRSNYRLETPTTQCKELTPGEMSRTLELVSGGRSLVPVYDAESLDWMLGQLQCRPAFGECVGLKVEGADEKFLGWLLLEKRKNHVEVIAMAALPAAREQVMDHLLFYAQQADAVTVGGRVDPAFRDVLCDRQIPVTFGQPWSLVYSTDRELTHAVLTGDCFWTRLDGEWWVGF